MRHLKKGLVIVAAVLVFVFLAGWVFLSAAFMAGPRKAVFETILTGKLDQDVRIEGDLRIELGSPLQISAEGLALPSRSMPSLELAEIGSLSFDLPVSKLWAGQIRLTNLQSDGVHLRMVIDENGVRSWDANPTGSDRSKDRSVDVSDPAKALSEILPDQVLTLTNTTVTYQSAIDGLDLNLRLSEIKLDKGDGTTGPTFDSTGDLNGEALTLSGSFPKAEPFQASADFDQIKIAFNGSQSADGFEMKMAADILELGQLLDILKLNRVLEGTGHIGAVLKSAEGITRIDDVSILAELEGGQSLEVTGHLGEMGNPADVSLTTRIRLYSEDNRPPVATSRRDLKLISVDMVIDSVPGQVPQREMVIETNGFVMETSGEGPPPIEFSQISRSPDGILQLGKLNLRIGPPKTPFIVLDGSVKDALQLQGIAAEGLINVSAGSLIAPEQLQSADALGEFSGNFHLDGNINKLTLTNLDGKTQNTDLWDLEVHGSVSNVLKFEDLDLNIDVDVPSGAALLSAMNLDPVDTGQTTLSARLKSHGADWDARASVNVAESSLDFTLNLDDVTTNPVLRGMIESDLIQLDHLRSIVSAAVSLRGLDQPDDQAPKDGADKAVTETEPKATGPIRDVTLKPIGRAILLSGMDMEVDIDLRKIEGAKGVSSIKSGLELKDSMLRAGPLKFEYGGGHFDVSGAMDLSDGADVVNLSGRAGGWQLDDILGTLNFKKGAKGTLTADFEVSGGTSSMKGFVDSMTGYATVSMSKGSIETQLLDLAGLGVVPWLFSKERQKIAPIECLKAPVTLSNGVISTKHTTLETDLVQIVVYGNVDLRKKSLDLNVQPRKIAKPLSRSPWPFTATGSLAKPKIGVKDGPKRLRRKDGAETMPANRKRCVPDILQLK